MITSLSRLHAPALLLLVPLALAGCPAKTGSPPPPSDFAIVGDMTGMRVDLSMPDMGKPADLAMDLAMADLATVDLTMPAGNDGAIVDANRPADLPAPVDQNVSSDGNGQGMSDGGARDGQVIVDAGSPDGVVIVDASSTDQARSDGGVVADLSTQPDMACLPLATFTNAQGFAGGNNIGLQPNVAVNVAAGQTVTITTWTTPSGANPGVHAIYATDAQFATQKDLVFTYDANPQGGKPPNGTDQWFVILPAQVAGTHVWVYLRADSCDKKSLYLPGNANYEYIAK